MKSIIKGLSTTALFTSIIYQPSALALTSYVATGQFFGDSLEVIQYDEDTGDETQLNAFLTSSPFNITASSFSLSFTVDESIEGRVPVFSPSAFFSGAVSNVSIDINGTNIFNSASEVATVAQFPGDFGGTLDASWGWSLFPELGSLLLPGLTAIDSDSLEPLGTTVSQGFDLRFFDSSRQIYNSGSFLDLITLDINDFDSSSFQLFWNTDQSEEPEFGGFPPDINYTVFGTIDSLTTSAVPLPGALWLFGSALIGITGLRKIKYR